MLAHGGLLWSSYVFWYLRATVPRAIYPINFPDSQGKDSFKLKIIKTRERVNIVNEDITHKLIGYDLSESYEDKL